MYGKARVKLSVINRISASAHHGPIFAILFCAFTIAPPALAQTIAGDPGPNENIIGPTPDPADIRDVDSRQQTEVACAVDVGDSACKICVYNDYRTVSLFGDGWQGVSQTCGDDWTSRIAPGHPNHPAPVNGNFAADPRVIAIPGMAIVNFIAGFRDNNTGMLGIQHWLKMVREDTDHWEPGLYTYSVDEGTSGRFIDKPDELFVPDAPADQGTITLSTEMENPELGTITREYPSGLLYVAYAVVAGNGAGLCASEAERPFAWRSGIMIDLTLTAQCIVSGLVM